MFSRAVRNTACEQKISSTKYIDRDVLREYLEDTYGAANRDYTWDFEVGHSFP